MKILIKNGFVIDPASKLENNADILIEDTKIKDVQASGIISEESVDKLIDAKDKWVVPGLVDLHVHLREPGFEWKATVGSEVRAAIKGGYTSICSMPNTNPANDSAEVTKYILKKAELANLAKVFPIGSVSIGLKGKELSPMSELYKAGCVAFSDDGEPIYNAQVMRRALEWCEMLNARISCHEEDKNLSCCGSMNESALSEKMGLKGFPGIAEDVMVARDIEIARYTGGKIHICHVSTARSVELIRRAKKDNIDVTAEVTAHHLLFTEDQVKGYDTNSKMSPPLRSEEDLQALREGLIDGTIDCLASDHAPHEEDSKNTVFDEATFGILGLQTSLPAILGFINDGLITRTKAIEILANNPAKCFNLPVGTLKIGSPADICIIDTEKEWTFSRESNLSKSSNSPFFDKKFKGCASTVLVDGRICMKDEEIIER